MAWAETNPVNERRRFIQDCESGHWSMTELCERYGISRKCGHARLKRFRQEGEAGLEDRSRAPLSCPHRTSEELEKLIVAERQSVRWGARKLLRVLRGRHPKLEWPARSTISDILDRNGLVQPRRRRRKWAHPGAVPPTTTEPNDLWTTDFKGQFRTTNGIYCYPLTIVDLHTRYLLRVHALPNVKTAGAKPIFERLFREVGMPLAIRSDNGPPFASTGIHGLCALNTWWMRLGITHQRIQPSSPQQNGAHERMHRTLKADTARPPAANHGAQQRRFDSFRHTYNEERPHEALGDETPGSLWLPSRRAFPAHIGPPEYPGHCEVRKVSKCGMFRLQSTPLFISQALNEEYIGLEEIGDGLWNILFYSTLLGRLDQRTNIITGASFRGFTEATKGGG